MFILRIIGSLNKYKVPYAVVGGYAVALHGAVRGTIDIDIITEWSLDNLKSIENAFNEINLFSKLPINAEDIYSFKDEYIKNRNLIAWTFINHTDPSELVDIIITYNLKNKTITKVRVKGETINILSKNDLIKMKKKSGRKQDLIDIKALEKLNEK